MIWGGQNPDEAIVSDLFRQAEWYGVSANLGQVLPGVPRWPRGFVWFLVPRLPPHFAVGHIT